MIGAEDALAGGQQRGVLVARGGRIPRVPGPAGGVGTGVQGGQVLGAGYLFAEGQQLGREGGASPWESRPWNALTAVPIGRVVALV